MNKFILATSKFENSSFAFTEEKILELLVKNNENYIIEKIYIQLNNTSKLFKEYPFLYYNGRLFETKKILPFIFELLFGNYNFENFEYLLIFLYNEFRYLYIDNLSGLFSKNIPLNEKRNIDIFKIIKDYIEYYKDKKEKVLIYNILFYFIEEYLTFQKGKENEIKNIHELKKLLKLNPEEIINCYKIKHKSLINYICDRYCVKNPFNKNEIFTEPEEIENKNNWKNNIFSLGLFLGFTSIFYLISLKNK